MFYCQLKAKLLKYNSRIRILMAMLVLAASPTALAQTEAEVTDDADVRESPEQAADSTFVEAGAFDSYPFLNVAANHIEFNGADWSRLPRKLPQGMRIVHIGDSHIQAEGSTSRTRQLLHERYGSAGRGLIVPFRLAGTNQPLDYTVTSYSDFASSRLLQRSWAVTPGFAGVALNPLDSVFDFTIAVKPRLEPEADVAFSRVKVFISGAMPLFVGAENADEEAIGAYAEAAPGCLTVALERDVTEVSLVFDSTGDCTICGFQLLKIATQGGIEYSAFGNNGATYSSYVNLGGVGEGVAAMSPELVIISLGANEAFSKISAYDLEQAIGALVSDIRRHNPDAVLLLTTPAECKRSVYTGKKRRRRRSYVVNTKVAEVRDAILRYGREHHIATYDWYDVAGGDGSASDWISAGLMGRDCIHLTWTGYDLQGSLMFDALDEALSSHPNLSISEQ